MISLLAQSASLRQFIENPMFLGMLVAALGLWMMVAGQQGRSRRVGASVGLIGLVAIAYALPRLPALPEQIVFWGMALISVGGAAAAVSSRSPVYTAIWFAFSLLGVAGLFVLQHAQFLGVATVVVYAGAIVVTFLFVLMLAQPEGHSSYDRLSWASFAIPGAVAAATVLLSQIAMAMGTITTEPGGGQAELAGEGHMAKLGAVMFTRQLVAVEVAGTLLLVALVGAIAIVIHGRQRTASDSATRTATETAAEPRGLGGPS